MSFFSLILQKQSPGTKCDETKLPYQHIAGPPASGQGLMNLLDITHMCQGVCARLHPRDLTAHETPKHSYDFTCAADRSSLSSGLWSFCKRKDRMRLLQRQTVVNTSCRMYNDGKTHSGSERLVISTAILVSGNFPDCFLDTLTSVQTI